jgi:hypothetical protein
VCIIDQAVIRGASAKGQLRVALKEGCLSFARHPLRFLASPGCRLMTLVYAGTYLTANTIEGLYNRQHWPWYGFPISSAPLSTPSFALQRRRKGHKTNGADIARYRASTKFAATSLANIGLTLYKDARFTKMYSSGPAKPIPATTFGCFTARDSLTMFASFTLPDKLAFYLRHGTHWHPELCENIVQWSLPCAVQWITTPLHLWGLHAYNVPTASLAERAGFVRKEFWSNLLTRSVRILPAFGLGGSVCCPLPLSLLHARSVDS